MAKKKLTIIDLRKKANVSRMALISAMNQMLQPLEEDPVMTDELTAWFKNIFNTYLVFYADTLTVERYEETKRTPAATTRSTKSKKRSS
jgi:hypothetical protein